MGSIWSTVLERLASLLTALSGAAEPFAGVMSWGVAIIALTVMIRILLMPLGVLQARTVRARRAAAPDIERIHRRFDTSPELRRRDPDRFLRNSRAKRERINEAHRAHGIRPLLSLAPVLAQSPVLFALYRMLTSPEVTPALLGAPFILIESLSMSVVAGAGVGAVILLAVVAATTYLAHRQMSAGAPVVAGQPRPSTMGVLVTGMMTAFAATLPAGVLLYWATTGLVTVAQQAVLLR